MYQYLVAIDPTICTFTLCISIWITELLWLPSWSVTISGVWMWFGNTHSLSVGCTHCSVAVAHCWKKTTAIPCCQVGVIVHHYLLIGGGARVGGVSWDGWCIGCCLKSNNPQHSQHILHALILTPEGDVASSTHIRGSWAGLSEDHWTCTDSSSGNSTMISI